MSEDTTGKEISLKDNLIMLILPFKPLIDMTKDSGSMQTGLMIASAVIYLIPIVFYIATKNILIALVSWLFVVWVLWRISQEIRGQGK
jgi:hypothetical protein